MRNVCGENVITPYGIENINFNALISLNESSALIWEKLQDVDFTTDDMAKILENEYEVSHETAVKDCEKLLAQWVEIGLCE